MAQDSAEAQVLLFEEDRELHAAIIQLDESFFGGRIMPGDYLHTG